VPRRTIPWFMPFEVRLRYKTRLHVTESPGSDSTPLFADPRCPPCRFNRKRFEMHVFGHTAADLALFVTVITTRVARRSQCSFETIRRDGMGFMIIEPECDWHFVK